MNNRLFRGWHIRSARMRKLHRSSDSRSAECWIPQETYNYINNADCTALTLLKILKNPNAYPDLQVATKKEQFFNESEHWHITMDFHVTDDLLIKRIDAGNTTCEICKKNDATMINEIKSTEIEETNQFAMCESCFDKVADYGYAE